MYKENHRQNCLLISHNHITICKSVFVRAGRFLHKRERSKFKFYATRIVMEEKWREVGRGIIEQNKFTRKRNSRSDTICKNCIPKEV